MNIADAPRMLTDRLEKGERLTWWGRPRQGVMLRKRDWFRIPFSVLWFSLVIVAASAAFNQPARWFWFQRIFVIPFILVGLWAIAGRFLHDSWRRSRTVYGLTSNTALIATPSNCQIIDLGNLGEIGVEEGRKGRGSIVLGPTVEIWEHGRHWSEAPVVPTFEGIEDVRRVLSMIRAAQKSADAQRRASSS